MIAEISVITPHYQSRSLFSTVDSVLAQSYPRIQYIIVVDGSKGFPPDKIREYLRFHTLSNIRWQVIGLPQNMGTVYALNRALAQAEGEYIFNLADDDVFTSTSVLEDWTQYMVQKNAMFCTAKRRVVDGENPENYNVEPSAGEIEKIERMTAKQLFDELAVRNFVFGSSTAQSKECFRKFGNYDSQYRLTEDYPRVMKLLREGVRLDFFPQEVVSCQAEGISSPKRILSLLDENECIFTNEILPYCAHPLLVRFKHWLWKFKTVRHGVFLARFTQANTWCKKCLLYVQFPDGIYRMIRKACRRSKNVEVHTID